MTNISAAGDSSSSAHLLLYPFGGSGHIIPLLDLTQLLLTRGLTITLLVSPATLPLLDPLLSSHPSTLHTLILSPPDPVDTTTPTYLSLLNRIRTSAQLYDPIVRWFRSHPSPPVAIVSDFFVGWTNQLASELGVPRLVFSPSGAFGSSMFHALWRDVPENVDPGHEDMVLSFPQIPSCPSFPWWQMTHLSRYYKQGDPDWEFFRNGVLANEASWGLVYNSYYKLEGTHLDYLKKKLGHDRVWAVGPLLPIDNSGSISSTTERGGSSAVPPHEVMNWLDGKSMDSVVYVCFGSRVTLSEKHVEALTAALERSKVHFILCLKASDSGFIPSGFEDRVSGRGFIIKGWTPQVEILRHRAVGVFVTHCGWNSVLEGVAAGVMLLTWPNGADQFANAKLLGGMGVAARVCEGGPESIPDSTELARLLDESVSGNRPERVKAMELRDAASEAVNGGSSSEDLDNFVKHIYDLSTRKEQLT